MISSKVMSTDKILLRLSMNLIDDGPVAQVTAFLCLSSTLFGVSWPQCTLAFYSGLYKLVTNGIRIVFFYFLFVCF